MAQISGLGFSGVDHLNTGFEHLMRGLDSQQSFAWNGKDLRRNLRYQKKMIRFQNEQTKGMSLWSAKEMPAATMAGLKAAGLNPLLAAGGSTNVAPTVASSASSVPYSESYQPTNYDFSSGSSGSFGDLVGMFSGTTVSAKRAEKTAAQATAAEQKTRKEWFESEEGKKAVRDKLRMDYGPQSSMQAAVLGAHTAGDAARSIVDAHDEGTTNQLLAFLQDKARSFDRWFWEKDNPRSYFYDGPSAVRRPKSRPKPSVSNRRDSHDRNRTEYHFHFGSSAKNYDGGSRTNQPVWYNPDLKR